MSVPYDHKVRDSSVVRREISLGQPEVMGLQIVSNGALTDPTSIQVNIYQEDNYDDSNPDGALLATYTYGADAELVREEPGIYSFVLQPELTSVKSLFRVEWTYVTGGHTFKYNDYYIVLERMPTYDALSDSQKMVVQQIAWMFGDLFDNTVGGTPYFQGEFQTHYSYERIAQLMHIGVDKINFARTPVSNFYVGAGTGQPFPTTANGLLRVGTYIEILKHFVRTYVEQPSIQSAGVSYADRRDYMQRWQSVLQDEQKTYDDMLRQFKRSQMSLGAGRLIVSGGMYGGGGGRGVFVPGMWAAQITSGRMFPATFPFGTGL